MRTDPPKIDGGVVMPASLAEVGATSDTTFDGGDVQGFILEVPAGVDEVEAVQKLSSHADVMRVVPDTWVGIAAATGGLLLGLPIDSLQQYKSSCSTLRAGSPLGVPGSNSHHSEGGSISGQAAGMGSRQTVMVITECMQHMSHSSNTDRSLRFRPWYGLNFSLLRSNPLHHPCTHHKPANVLPGASRAGGCLENMPRVQFTSCLLSDS